MKDITFEIKTRTGTEIVKGKDFYPFAIHRYEKGKLWKISHVPTGLMMPLYFSTLAPAADFIRGVKEKSARFGFSWIFTKTDNKATMADGAEIFKKVRDDMALSPYYCLYGLTFSRAKYYKDIKF